jgi:dTDP-glucose 4,6-dehydratase
VPRALVTGGAGFLGSHLCDRLIGEGWEVVCVDSLSTGSVGNIGALMGQNRFRFERHDITDGLDVEGPFDWVLHLASPASPVDYLELPIETLKVGGIGTIRALELARDRRAGFLLASTSEVYGDPLVHPQPETYWGNVNPVGPRSVYDEAKRYSEAATMAYHRTHGVPVRILRIFNTFGPRMRANDGRAVPTFIQQAIRNEPLTVHGDGTQTRSLCFVDDLIEGMYRLVQSSHVGPVNVGNPEELTMIDLARLVRELAGSKSEIITVGRPVDDPERRRPDISLAGRVLGWEPTVPLAEGLQRTIQWARSSWT